MPRRQPPRTDGAGFFQNTGPLIRHRPAFAHNCHLVPGKMARLAALLVESPIFGETNKTLRMSCDIREETVAAAPYDHLGMSQVRAEVRAPSVQSKIGREVTSVRDRSVHLPIPGWCRARGCDNRFDPKGRATLPHHHS